VHESPTISIVDDDPSVRSATEGWVRSIGLSARTFSSAEEFLRSPSVSDTACIISDVAMPGMSGIEMLDALIEQGYRVPVIFVTAFSDEGARKRALNAGAIGFLAKPFDGRSLIACLGKALRSNIDLAGEG
jgi:FixJ family two-component response regulator